MSQLALCFPARRLPLGPLAAYVREVWHDAPGGEEPILVAHRRVEVALGRRRDSFKRRVAKGFTLEEAESIADELRAHPAEVWGRAYYELVDDQ